MNTNKKATIFDFLAAADKHDVIFGDDNEKDYVPLLCMRWQTGTNIGDQICRVNDCVNPYVFNLHKHKTLLWKLTCAASNGKYKKYNWLKIEKNNKHTQTLLVITKYYNCSSLEAKTYLPLIDNESLIDMAVNLGYDKDEMTKLKTELKNNV